MNKQRKCRTSAAAFETSLKREGLCELELEEWKIVLNEVGPDEREGLIDFWTCALEAGLSKHDGSAGPQSMKSASVLLRFLRARNGNVQKSLVMLNEAMDWRRDFELDRKMEAWKKEWEACATPRAQLLRRHDFMGRLGVDYHGLPVYIHRLSLADPAGIAREVGIELFLLHHILPLEENFAIAQTRLLETRKSVTSFVEIYDLGNYGVGHWWRRAWGAFYAYRKYIHVMETCYPDRLRVGLILRAPQTFSTIWSVILPLLPQDTKKKIHVKGWSSSEWIHEIESYLPSESIPDYLRSEDLTVINAAKPCGGMVEPGALDALIRELKRSGRAVPFSSPVA